MRECGRIDEERFKDLFFLRNVLEEWRWTFSSTADSWKEALVLFFWTASPSYDVAYDVYAF